MARNLMGAAAVQVLEFSGLTGRVRARCADGLRRMTPLATPASGSPWPGRALTYGLPAVIAAVAVALWFRPGAFVALGDIPPFVRDNLRSELWSSWNHQLSGAGSASYDVGRLLDVVLLRVAELLHLPATTAQRALYVLVAAASPCGVAYWARSFGLRPGAAALAGLLGLFNPYVMVSMPNLLPLMTVGIAGAVGGLLLRAGDGSRRSVAGLVLVTLPVSYVALNPPLVAMLLAWAGICLALVAVTHGLAGVGRSLRLLGCAAPIVVLVHLWWLVPAWQTLAGDDAGVKLAAVTDVDEWAWTQAENSLANVTTLRAFWGWPYPEYVPYAGELDAGPWVWLAWLLPVAALAGMLLARGPYRRALRLLGLVAVVLLVVAKGIHPPFADLNRALYQHVPGFWLLREPMSKVGALLVPIYAVLVAACVDRMVGNLRARGRERSWRPSVVVPHAARVGVVAGCVLALAYPWPLWTGAVVPDARGQFPGGHVVVPSSWEQAADLVNRSPIVGKALVLPLDPQYQVLTTWGYQGIDSIPQQLLTRPVIQPLPDIYFGASEGFLGLVQAVEDGLETGNSSGVPPLLDALGVSHVLMRRDLEPSPLLAPTADETELAATARQLAGWQAVGEFDVVEVFERQGPAPLVRSADALTTVAHGLADDPGLVASAVATAGVDELVATVADRVGADDADAHAAGSRRSWAFPADQPSTTVPLDRAGPYEVSSRLRARSLHFVAAGTDEAGQSSARARSTLAATFDDHVVFTPSEQSVALDAPASAVDVGGTILALGPDAEIPVLAGPGEPATLWGNAAPVAMSPLGPADRCGRARRPGKGSSLGGSVQPVDGGVQLVGEHGTAACAVATALEPVASSDVLRVSFEHRTETGLGAQICVRETATAGCADIPDLLSDGEWRPYVAFVHPRMAATGMRVELATATGGRDDDRTVVGYRNLTVERLGQVGVIPLDSPLESTLVTDLAAGPHTLSVSSTQAAPTPVQFGGLEDCFAFDSAPVDKAGLALEQSGDTIGLRARSHSACTSGVVDPSLSSGLYRVAFDYRTVSGNRARACLWQEGRQRCARLPELTAGDDWTSYAAYVRPEPGTSGLRLYLYADGDGRRVTETEYRKIEVAPVAPVLTTVTEAAAAAPTATVTWDQVDTTHYDVHVEGSTGSLVLALGEAHVGGWHVDGLPDGWEAEHLEVNGYANGWRLTGSGSADLRLTYRPARVARQAAWVSALTVVAATLVLAVVLVVRLRRHRKGRQPPVAQNAAGTDPR